MITNNYAAPEAAETYIMASSDPEEDEKHTPTADGRTGRKQTFELQHQVDADLLATGAVPIPTWEALPDANHYDTIAYEHPVSLASGERIPM